MQELPEGVERWQPTGDRNGRPRPMLRAEFGGYLKVSDLPAILAREREKWEAEFKDESVVEARVPDWLLDEIREPLEHQMDRIKEAWNENVHDLIAEHMKVLSTATDKRQEIEAELAEFKKERATFSGRLKAMAHERDRAKAQALAELREEIEALPRYEDTRGPLVAGRLIERKAVLYILDQEDQLDRLDRAEGEGRR